MSRRATIHQHIYGVVAAACPRPRGGTDRKSRPVYRIGDAPKDFGLSTGVLDHSVIKGVAKREPHIVENIATITRARVIAVKPPTMCSRNPSCWAGSYSTMKSESQASSPLTLPNDPNSPLVSTASSVGPNGQNASSSVGASSEENEIGWSM